MDLKNAKSLMVLLTKVNLIILSFLSSYATEGDSSKEQRNLQSRAFTDALIVNNPHLSPNLQKLPKSKAQPIRQNVNIIYWSASKEKSSQLKNTASTIEIFRDAVNAQLVSPTLYERGKKFTYEHVKKSTKEVVLISLHCLIDSIQSADRLAIEIGILERKLTLLNTLSLTCQNISTLPIEVAGLIHLQVLDCSHNNIKEIPTQIGKLTNLTDLRIAKNELSDLPSQIGKLENLTYLDWSANQINQAPTELGNLTNLKSLGLAGNPLIMLPFTYTKWLNTQLAEMIIFSNAPVADYFFYKPAQKNRLILSRQDIRYYQNCTDNEKHWIFLGVALIGYDLNSEDEKCSLKILPNEVREHIWENIKGAIKQEIDKIRPRSQQPTQICTTRFLF